MPSPDAPPGDPFGRKILRQALRGWDASGRLGTMPLASTRAAVSLRQAAGYRDTLTGRGLAVRDLLRRALEALRPGPDAPDPGDPRWRGYLILTGQYVHGRAPDFLAETLSVARSTYDHEQAEALDHLGAILREWGERELPSEPARRSPSSQERRKPHLAPPPPEPALVGRQSLLDESRARLLGPSRSLVLSGLPGVGKTALAATLAHDPLLQDAFPDGVLWAGLGRQPDLAARLGAWGLALGWTMDEMAAIPALEDRARALQAALHARRMLIVADDAWTLQAGRAMQLGGPDSGYLVTTRLPALAAELAGDSALTVPELDPVSGEALLRSFAPDLPGPAVERLVQAVGGLPLSLVLMGRHLRLEGRTAQLRRVDAALDRLLDPAARMDLVEGRSSLEAQPSLPIDVPVTLRNVIALSDAGLSEASRAVLGALAVFPPKPNSFNEHAALAVSNGAAPAWDALLDAGLIDAMSAGRFALHPSVADYAATLGGADDAAPRFIEWAVSLPALRSHDPAALAVDEVNVLAALDLARDSGRGRSLVRLLEAWFTHFERAGRLEALGPSLTAAVEFARASGTPDVLGAMLAQRAGARYRDGDYPGAREDARASLALAEAGGDSRAVCAGWKVLALSAQALGDPEEAEACIRRGMDEAAGAGLVQERAELLTNLAAIFAKRGNVDEARRTWQAALALARAVGARRLEGMLLTNLSVLAAQAGDLAAAQNGFAEALELAHAGDDRAATTSLLINLGALAFDRGDLREAEDRFREALDLAQARGDPAGQVHVLANLGRVVGARGGLDEAERLFAEALVLGRRIGHREHLAQVLINAGAAYRMRGRASEARELLEEARTLAQALAHARFLAAAQTELDLLDS